ncbi:PASTA domain-containing protein [Rhodococcus sp. F64268]|uniref:PASTA domain-containing protein n=1 Tax=Rhodococcus sp. F64268 TaxID=2926402 RepID=UPI001FF3E3F5|nr:PASTA domain-containing protein [Rhodococcus sp. F64268]MCK0090465.1 PASTA domain-containing protein [Rhodococcus sp. F64268]
MSLRRGRPTSEVPDVVGFDADDACAMVLGSGFVPVGPDNSPAPSTGVIVAQQPPGSTSAEPGAEVILWNQDAGSRSHSPLPGRDESATLDPA